MVSTFDHPYCNTLHAFTSGFDPEGAKGLKGKLVGHKKWIGTAGMIVSKSSYRLADLCVCKNYTWHSRTKGFRMLHFETRRRHRSYCPPPRSRLADFDTPRGSMLQYIYIHIWTIERWFLQKWAHCSIGSGGISTPTLETIPHKSGGEGPPPW